MKPKGAACCVFVWACSDEALGWAACSGLSRALGHGLWGVSATAWAVFVYTGLRE